MMPPVVILQDIGVVKTVAKQDVVDVIYTCGGNVIAKKEDYRAGNGFDVFTWSCRSHSVPVRAQSSRRLAIELIVLG
jgi:hypothetical protein